MPENDIKHRVTVESLLQLKRNERPNPEFWDTFDKDFDRRRLNALVNRPSVYDVLIRPAIRLVALGVPAVALIMFTFVWKPVERVIPGPLVINENIPGIAQTESQDQPVVEMDEVLPAAQIALADNVNVSNQFVMDAIEEKNHSSMRFRKVLYTPAIRLSVPSGAFYVRDSLSSSSYKVTTADAQHGRNF